MLFRSTFHQTISVRHPAFAGADVKHLRVGPVVVTETTNKLGAVPVQSNAACFKTCKKLGAVLIPLWPRTDGLESTHVRRPRCVNGTECEEPSFECLDVILGSQCFPILTIGIDFSVGNRSKESVDVGHFRPLCHGYGRRTHLAGIE